MSLERRGQSWQFGSVSGTNPQRDAAGRTRRPVIAVLYTVIMPEPKRSREPGLTIALLVLTATILVGIFALLSLTGPLKEAHALCLIAAALAFGLASNAMWRR